METFTLKINKQKYKQFKSLEEALLKAKKIKIDTPNSIIEIIHEEYCEYGHSDTCCKPFLLYKYENGIENKYI